MLKVLIWQTKFGNTRVRRIPHFILSPYEFHVHGYPQMRICTVWFHLLLINPIKAGGLNLCIAWGGEALENSYRVEMHDHSPIFQGQIIEKKLDR